MLFLALVLLVLAYVVGSLPLGYWLLTRLGFNPRTVSAYNLGVENVVRQLGPTAALASAALDLLKGFLAVLMASSLQQAEVAVMAGLAAFAGHLYPPRFLFPHLPPRGRGNLVLLGVFAGLYVGGLSLWITLLPLVVWAAVIGLFGFASAATVAGLSVFAIALSLSALPTAAKLAGWALLALSAWRFKENLGRIVDGTEPRVGDDVPMRGKNPKQVVTAFMIHPLTVADFWETRRFAWMKPLVERGVLTERSVRAFAAQLRPMKLGELRGIKTSDGTEIRMYLLSSPLLPDVIQNQPELAVKRAIEGARLAHELGASVVGLGAFWSVVGNKGEAVQSAVPEITVTNGGAYTAGTIKAAIPGILSHFENEGRDLKQAVAAVVGANGVVSFGIARTITPQVRKVILVGRDLERLERSAASLRRLNPDTEIVTTIDIATIREADLIFSATSDPNPVIFPEHVKHGAWIFDEGRPADVHDTVALLPGVRVIPGGVVRPPGQMRTNIDVKFGESNVPACLAETLIIAATGEHERKSLGPQTKTENINFFVDQAEKLGFRVID
ncbi:glycerol-3-phosphate acyltransferase [Deinococcus peraridilitoris]|uniref:Glycerol-3-phosphate acyltransferase n=1 Tax=Deinococcus peraridilitoris (strain DSM 19664 / LMG 22246 / CIP 109416 / KR-200) TaxID=937777 RepID=L0A4V0_DEIPD|nr:glycerol-3-phosphate acyltransferase [Deinococcus peraridilitoris]AFZ68886.1 putative dehydrogenase [Deinococcus peraridilitoris DSM 19664]